MKNALTIIAAVTLAALASAQPRTARAQTSLPTHVISQIEVGDSNVCALTTVGTVWCWGAAQNTGRGVTSGTHSFAQGPVLSAADTPVTGITGIGGGNGLWCGFASGTVWCWGGDSHIGGGQGANGGFATRVVDVGGTVITDFLGVSVGSSSACGVRDAGGANQMWCWGNNGVYHLGQGNTTHRDYAVQVQVEGGGGLENVSDAVAGNFGVCAAVTNGTAYCWGRNTWSSLIPTNHNGNLTRANLVLSPVPGVGIARIEPTASSQSAMTLNDGSIWSMGYNNARQLANGETSTYVPNPTRMLAPSGQSGFLSGVVDVQGDSAMMCALLNDGQVYCAGSSPHGNAASSSSVLVPVRNADNSADLTGIRQFSMRGGLLCLLTDEVLCTGAGTSSDRMGPTAITGGQSADYPEPVYGLVGD